MKKKPKL